MYGEGNEGRKKTPAALCLWERAREGEEGQERTRERANLGGEVKSGLPSSTEGGGGLCSFFVQVTLHTD